MQLFSSIFVLTCRELKLSKIKGEQMTYFTKEQRKESIVKTYTKVATQGGGCGCGAFGCCDNTSEKLGYDKEDLASIPKDAIMELGCGNPTVFASLKEGETVLDLGSGGGIDCFIASQKVGANGLVIGVDMIPEMVEKSQQNMLKGAYTNVVFRLGEIEHLPVEDNSIDVIISNCVINLSIDKQKVFDEAYRVLKKGGRLAISDIVLTQQIPQDMITLESYGGCIAGASFIDEIEKMLANSGFQNIKITHKNESKEFLKNWMEKIENFIVSAKIEAVK